MVYEQFATRLKSIPLALSALKQYILASKHAPVHIKLVYNVFSQGTFIEGTFSSQVPTTEITNDLTSSINFIVSNLISSYLMTYQKVFLSRIIIDSDIDMLGVVYDSIKVTCRFKTNIEKYAISNEVLLKSIFDQTVEAAKCEILERPANNFSIQLLRHRLRSVQVISDYSADDHYNSYQHPFSSEILVNLMGLIKIYENPNNQHQASAKLYFDLHNRNHLKFNQGQIYPTEELKYRQNRFDLGQINHVLSQTEPILAAIDTAQIDRLELFMTHNRLFKCQFGLTTPQSESIPTKNFMQINNEETVLTWQNVFNHVVANYSIPNLSEAWLQNIVVKLSPFASQWVVDFSDYSLTHNFDSYLPQDQVLEMVNSVAKQSNGKDKIKSIILAQEQKKTKMLKLQLEPLSVKSNTSELAMQLKNTDTDGKVIHYFDLNENKGYYLSHDKYMKMVK